VLRNTGSLIRSRNVLERTGTDGETPVDDWKGDSSVIRVTGLGSGQ
jgi:hypothetical protein